MNLPTYKNQVNTNERHTAKVWPFNCLGRDEGESCFLGKKSSPNLIEQEYLDLENEKNGKYE